jgi:hypothetical protein
MFNIHETVDSNEYLQDQDRELRVFLSAVYTGGSGAFPLSSIQDTSASQLSEYGANNILLPPLAEPLQRPSTTVRVSEPIDEAPETPKTGNVIQPLFNNSVPPKVNQFSTFECSRLTQYDPFNIQSKEVGGPRSNSVSASHSQANFHGMCGSPD